LKSLLLFSWFKTAAITIGLNWHATAQLVFACHLNSVVYLYVKYMVTKKSLHA
jgi:hypothetical protein